MEKGVSILARTLVCNAMEINRGRPLAIGSFADSHYYKIGLRLINEKQAVRQYENSKVKTKTLPIVLAAVVATMFVKPAALGVPAADDNLGQHLPACVELQAFAL